MTGDLRLRLTAADDISDRRSVLTAHWSVRMVVTAITPGCRTRTPLTTILIYSRHE